MKLFAIIKEDFESVYNNDPAIHSKLELIFNYPGIWAIVNYRVANKFYYNGWKLSARFLMGISQFLTSIDIHPACKIGRRVFIDHGFGVVIGETAEIGDDVLIYQGVTLGGVTLNKGKRHPTICNGVVIGAGAKILGNIKIGEQTKIGANSVVVREVPAYSTAVGIPAKIIKKGKCARNKLNHHNLPDIDKEMFEYLIKKVAVLEYALSKENKNIEKEDKELDEIYKIFIASMKNE